MSDPSASRRPTHLPGIAGLALALVTVLMACSSAATTPPVATPTTASPAAIVSQAPATTGASPDAATASPAEASPSAPASPSPTTGTGRYGGGTATPTPAPTPKTTPRPTPKPVSVVVKSASITSLGKVLVGPNGMTLYTLSTDPANRSGCSGSCADNWPPFLVKAGTSIKGGSGIGGSFSSFARSGKRQVTYKGRALYYFAGDAYTGDANGQGVNGVWYVAKP